MLHILWLLSQRSLTFNLFKLKLVILCYRYLKITFKKQDLYKEYKAFFKLFFIINLQDEGGGIYI